MLTHLDVEEREALISGDSFEAVQVNGAQLVHHDRAPLRKGGHRHMSATILVEDDVCTMCELVVQVE